MSETAASASELDPFKSRPIMIYDVGARGELQKHWHQWAVTGHEGAAFTLFEPDPPAAEALRNVYAGNPQARVIEAGLYHRSGSFPLHVTRHATCSSLLKPNFDVLSRYYIAGIFEVMHTVQVTCGRMDEIVREHDLAPPDFCKLDVQGAEYEVLLGMGKLLESCLALEMETHFYPIYEGQKLLSDIIALLDGYGFSLRDLRPQHHFDADFVEVNAFFAKREAGLEPEALARLELIKQKLKLQTWPTGFKIHQSLVREQRAERAAALASS